MENFPTRHEKDQLEAAYNGLFEPFTDTNDNGSLAQPYPQRYVQSVTTDHTLLSPQPWKKP